MVHAALLTSEAGKRSLGAKSGWQLPSELPSNDACVRPFIKIMIACYTTHTHCRKKSRDDYDYDEQQWASSVLVWCTKREKDPNWPKSRVFLSSHNTWSWEASRHCCCCCFSNECWREYRRSALIFSTMMQADMMMIILLSCCCCLFKNFSVIFLSINLLTAAAVMAPVWK